jgi:hypothetical protein
LAACATAPEHAVAGVGRAPALVGRDLVSRRELPADVTQLSVPGSAGLSAREMPCARVVCFENASRAKMPALPGTDFA